MFERHLQLKEPLRSTAWRKIAIGTWRSAKDPTVYGLMELKADKALEFIDKLKASSGERITMTHFLGKAVAECFHRNPEINGILRFGRIYPRQNVTLFFQVATDDEGKDLSGVTVREAELKSVVAIAKDMVKRVKSVKDLSDSTYKQMKSLMGILPGWLTGIVLDVAGFIQFSLNIWSPLLGLPKDPLGSVMITNVGMLGIDCALAPLVAYSRVPMVLTVGALKPKPVVENDAICIRPMLTLGITFDHRLIDGVHAAKMARLLEEIFAAPERFFALS